MEPGHEDREYAPCPGRDYSRIIASMEPGHEDREYETTKRIRIYISCASMEPGHEDREYAGLRVGGDDRPAGLNGARS